MRRGGGDQERDRETERHRKRERDGERERVLDMIGFIQKSGTQYNKFKREHVYVASTQLYCRQPEVPSA